jgi:hypothetical protein
MERCTVFEIDSIKVLFTPEGKISVIDAIQALAKSRDSHKLWKTIYERNPSILNHCEVYDSKYEKPFLAADIEGWDKISGYLFEELALNRE